MELLGSPGRTLASIVVFVLAIMVLATAAYVAAGWPLLDSAYMVLLTVYTVGYGEVRPIDTPYLHAVTMGTMVLGCTGMILLTGALIQFLTVTQLQILFGGKRVKAEIDKLANHVIVVGFGRIGSNLVRDLAKGGSKFVVIEQNEKRAQDVRELGYPCLVGDATDERALTDAGIGRARALATVLPNDAANVFITLSARSLNPKIEIIARGELSSTEGKLLRAGANRVVMPTQIGAERIAEMILFPETGRFLDLSDRMAELERALRRSGLDLELVRVPEKSIIGGKTVADIEALGKGRFFVLEVERKEGGHITAPEQALKIAAGDRLVIVGRHSEDARALFD